MVLLMFVSGYHASHAHTDKYRIMWRDDPSTTMVIGWNQVSGSNPIVYYGTTDYGTNWLAYPYSRTVDRAVVYKGMNNHFVRLSGLQSNQAYYFVIKDSEGTSKRFWFKTAPDDPSVRLSIIAGGDSRNNRIPRQNANKLVGKLRPHTVLFGGDMTDKGYDSEWRDWFDDWQLTNGSDGRMIPIIAARGNHESTNYIIVNLFDVSSPNVYYALNMGGSLLRLYTLNTELSISGNQTTWLANDLTSNSNVTWKIAQYHKPIRPHVASKAEATSQYTYWAPLFYKHKVKLVIECDAHTTKTTWPIRPYTGSGSSEGFIRDDNSGTVYAGEGCWGAPLRRNDDDKPWTRNSGMLNQFNWIFIDQEKIEVRTIKTDNADNVGTVSDDNIFAAPLGLDIWNPSNGPVITIYPQSTNATLTTISSRISSGNDDVEENKSGIISLNSTDIELAYDNYQTGNQTIGLRFTGCNIPQGARISSAFVQFTVDEASSGTTNLTVRGHDADNSPAFTDSNFDVSNRTNTAAVVTWAPSSWSPIGASGLSQRSNDLKTIIQEIVNRAGWEANNALTLLITGSGRRVSEAYEGSASTAAVLQVTYETATNVSALTAKTQETSRLTEKVSSETTSSASPNPFDEKIIIRLNRYYKYAVLIYSFIDASGKEHLTSSVNIQNTDAVEVDTRSIQPGHYILRAQVEGQIIRKKLLKR
jgi:hypothetical protein